MEESWHLAWQHIIQQIQLTVPKRTASSQLELMYHEILYLREGLVDVLAYFLLVLNKGDGASSSAYTDFGVPSILLANP